MISSLSIIVKNSFLVFFIIFFSLQIHGQEKNGLDSFKKTTWQLFKHDIESVFGGIGYSYSRPLHWKGEQWKTFGAVSAGTGLLYLFDEQTSEFARNQKEGIPLFIRKYGSEIGKPENNYILTSGVYLTGLFTKNEKLRRTGVLLLASASSAGFLQQVTKSFVGRARPVSGKGKDTFDPFNPSRNFHSFPSGHAILAFTNAYAIAKQFKDPWLKTGIYVVGLVPGVSRLWDGQHWLTDVALGVAISIFTVESIDRYLDKRYNEKYNDQLKKVSWSMNFGPGQIGFTAHF
ncbi:Undecaprenyl-diphosphate phosphatase [Flagellimonas maritima]|uniref:Undecaprenyl-diphosphate phosphatase n=1 Tax=Flagellimonas maritima TaxID=1383885 RepID=A0A2Z4LWS2_9FLAO|nr:Undecaprenyl-diphosphate phosphatase [Allomuricauda aurantiaca]